MVRLQGRHDRPAALPLLLPAVAITGFVRGQALSTRNCCPSAPYLLTLQLPAQDSNAVAILLSRVPPKENGALSFNLYRAKMTRQYGRLRYINFSGHKLLW